MKIVDFAIRRRVTVLMIFLSAIVFGMISYSRLRLDLLPDITYPSLTVRTEYPGSAPAEVENLISKPIEEAVGVVNGVIRVSSISRPGLSDVIIEFDWNTNMDFAALDVREKLDLVNLPKDASQPILLRYDPSLDPIMRVGLFGDPNLIALRLFAEENIKQELESLEGVAAVQVNGGMEEEIHVEVNQAKLAAMNIPISQVANRLAQENINLTGGTLIEGDMEYIVRTLNQFTTVDEINDIIIARRGNASILLRDVGRAFKSYKERKVITRIGGQESVELDIYKEADANTVNVARKVRERLAQISSQLSESGSKMRLEVISDQSRFIKQSIDDVLNSAIIGGLLAMMILYFFLQNVLSTAIISLAIPISVIVTFFLMYVSGISLNIMSLGGLALGVGMLVDNAIVVLESIDRHRKRGLDAEKAAFVGTSEVGKAVTASTLTTIFVFVPIVFVQGIAGQLFTDQAMTVTYSLLASLFVALTLIPMLSSLKFGDVSEDAGEILETKPPNRVLAWLETATVSVFRALKYLFVGTGYLLKWILWPFYWAMNRFFQWIFRTYPGLLDWSLTHRLWTIGIALVLLVLSYAGYRFIGTELIPEMSQGEFITEVKLPTGTPIEQTDRVLTQMSELALQDPRIERVFSVAGATAQQGMGAAEERENIGQIHVTLKRASSREEELKAMDHLRELWANIPGVEYKFSRPTLFSFKTPIEVEIKGYNLQVLEDISKTLAQKMREIPGLVDVKTSLEGGNPEVQISFNRERLAALGTDVGTIAQLIRSQVQGTVATEFRRLDRKIDVRVRAREDERETLDALRRLIINPSEPVGVPLYAAADVRIERGPSEIRRVDQERVALVYANLKGRDLGSVSRDIQKAIDSIPVPPSFSISIGGQNKEMAVSFSSMTFAILLAIFLVYIVMASQFESLLHPFVIMFTIPFGLVGVVLALLLTGTTISVVALIGVIMLAGIVVNNAIVLVDYINHLRRNEGYAKIDAIKEAGKVRLRPILMTTTTTVLGLLPMAIGFGEGAEVRAPMAIVVIGGLIVSTLLTLVILPTVYSVMDRGD